MWPGGWTEIGPVMVCCLRGRRSQNLSAAPAWKLFAPPVVRCLDGDGEAACELGYCRAAESVPYIWEVCVRFMCLPVSLPCLIFQRVAK